MRRGILLVLAAQGGWLHAAIVKPTATAPTIPAVEIVEWLASGSGCKGGSTLPPGNVTMHLQRDAKNPRHMEITFQLAPYALEGALPINPEHPTFARECAFRIAAQPGAHMRIQNIIARSSFHIEKEKGAWVGIQARLLTVTQALRSWSRTYEKEWDVRKETVPLMLEPDIAGRNQLKSMECGESKLLGLDLSVLNKRDSFTPKVSVHSGIQLVLSLDMESC